MLRRYIFWAAAVLAVASLGSVYAALKTDVVPVIILLYDKRAVLEMPLRQRGIGEKVPKKEFAAYMKDAAMRSAAILIFMEESLAVDEISLRDNFGVSLPNLELRFGRGEGKYIPYVESAVDALNKLFPPDEDAVVELKDPSFNYVDLPSNKLYTYKYIFFDDRQAPADETIIHRLRRHDMIAENVFVNLRDEVHGPIIGVFTGFQARLYPNREPTGHRTRKVKQRNVQLPDLREVLDWPASGMMAMRLFFNEFELEFQLCIRSLNWTLKAAVLYVDGAEKGRTILEQETVDFGNSLRCGDLPIINRDNGITYYIQWYQLQPFLSADERKGHDRKARSIPPEDTLYENNDNLDDDYIFRGKTENFMTDDDDEDDEEGSSTTTELAGLEYNCDSSKNMVREGNLLVFADDYPYSYGSGSIVFQLYYGLYPRTCNYEGELQFTLYMPNGAKLSCFCNIPQGEDYVNLIYEYRSEEKNDLGGRRTIVEIYAWTYFHLKIERTDPNGDGTLLTIWQEPMHDRVYYLDDTFPIGKKLSRFEILLSDNDEMKWHCVPPTTTLTSSSTTTLTSSPTTTLTSSLTLETTTEDLSESTTTDAESETTATTEEETKTTQETDALTDTTQKTDALTDTPQTTEAATKATTVSYTTTLTTTRAAITTAQTKQTTTKKKYPDFGPPIDCSPHFPIEMVTVYTVVLPLVILVLFVIRTFLNIQVPDRFDDPQQVQRLALDEMDR